MTKIKYALRFVKAHTVILTLLLFCSLSSAEDLSKVDLSPAGQISSNQYLLGGIAGTIFGFGIGHAIEGRYRSDQGGKGWVFTLGEAGPYGVLLAGSIIEWMADPCSGDANTHSDCQSSRSRIFGTPQAFDVATAVFVGFKIWEIIDVWNFGHQDVNSLRGSDTTGVSFALIPIEQRQLGVGIELKF